MDRTHWRLGRTDLNVLCVGLVYQGVSIPLEYQSLQKPGNSNTDERKRILTKVLAYLDPRVCCLVADREFIGRAWFAFLLEQQVDFVIRLRGNTSLTLDDGRRRYGTTGVDAPMGAAGRTAVASKKTDPHKKTWTKSHKPLSKRIRPTHTDHTPNTGAT